MQDEEVFVFLTLSFLMVFSGVLVIVLGLRHRLKILEMAHRERVAMIERGLVPPPDRGPAAFFHAMGARERRPAVSSRRMSFGIFLIGWGAGLALLIGAAFGAPDIGIGVGGAFAAIGGAMIVAARMNQGYDGPASTSMAAPPPMPPQPPPPAASEPPPLDLERS